MKLFAYLLEMVGVAAAAFSGATTGIKRGMDYFGVCILGITAACGGGLIRDVILGRLPPVMFRDGRYALCAIIVAIIAIILASKRVKALESRGFERVMLVADSIGLGVFTVIGVQAAISEGYGENLFFSSFLGVMTGVGGGSLCDVLTGHTPSIFVKHIYATASVVGAVICALLRDVGNGSPALVLGCVVVILIRLVAARYRLNMPRVTRRTE